MIDALNLNVNFKGKNVDKSTKKYPERQYATELQCDEYVKSDKSDKKVKAACSIAAAATAVTAATLVGCRHAVNKYVKLIKETPSKSLFKSIQQLGNSASIDAMTKLGNKQNLNINVIKDYKKAIKHGKNFNIGMLDMDNFKSINEVEGHITGDFFLTRIAEDAQAVAKRHNAKAYRYGGEEFVITTIGKSKKEMQGIMNEISQAIKDDMELQEKLPTFMKNIESQLKPLDKRIDNLQTNIFEKLKSGISPEEEKNLRRNIKNILNHYEKDPITRTNLLNAMNDKTFELKPDAKIDSVPLQVHLDRLMAPLKEERNDLLKWKNHAKRYNAFTISGGYATLTPETAKKTSFDTSKKLVDIVDECLKTAKLNGKNTMCEATEEAIKKYN